MLSSLPRRQLRKEADPDQVITPGSLPRRQLRKTPQSLLGDPRGSLPRRHLGRQKARSSSASKRQEK